MLVFATGTEQSRRITRSLVARCLQRSTIQDIALWQCSNDQCRYIIHHRGTARYLEDQFHQCISGQCVAGVYGSLFEFLLYNCTVQTASDKETGNHKRVLLGSTEDISMDIKL